MTRLFVALALASLSFMASAADKPLPVTVTNPVVPVEVANADPIPVTISGEPMRFQNEELLVINQGTFGRSISVFDVPADKTAIVKFVSGRAFTAVDSDVSCEVVRMTGASGAPLGSGGSHATLVQKRLSPAGTYTHEFSQEMEFYVEGGRSAGFTCTIYPAPVSATGTIVSLAMTGILVDAQ